MALSLLFFRRNSIFHIRFFLSRLLYLTLANLKQSSVCYFLVFADKFFLSQKKKKQQKKSFNSKVASHVLCPSFVSKLPRECEDITKNAWCTSLNAQCNIEYRLQYSLFFTFLSTIEIDYFFTFW